ncbi:hypothetical protein Ancab_026458 [Ancistrocladus abbreviatus]
MAESDYQTLQYEPTWVIAAVCSIILLISLSAERGLHRLGRCLKRNHHGALFEALQKVKEELMLLGFISLLLTVFQGSMSRICIPKRVMSHMLPCKKDKIGSEKNSHLSHYSESTWSTGRLLSESSDAERCAGQGKAPLIPLEATHQLHIFIFVLAIVYVFFCATTMVLGGMKVRRWKHWEDSIKREVSKSENEATRLEEIHRLHHQAFRQRAVYSSLTSWIVSFFKQFYSSLTKSDYIVLRMGFIMTHCPSNPMFDFHKYMMRTLQIDFKKVVGISWYLWAFVVLFLLLNLRGWHTYFWLSFLPLILLLLVGAKLDNVITCLAEEIAEKRIESSQENSNQDVHDGGEPWVKPSDKHFWFRRPRIVLYLIHFILFQNSFEIAFLLWGTYGVNSCTLDKVGFIIPRLVIGVIVQVICSYSTLPLYTIVTQMGTRFKRGIFDELTHDIMDRWAHDARRAFKIEMHRMNPQTLQAVPGSQLSAVSLEGCTSQREDSCCTEQPSVSMSSEIRPCV